MFREVKNLEVTLPVIKVNDVKKIQTHYRAKKSCLKGVSSEMGKIIQFSSTFKSNQTELTFDQMIQLAEILNTNKSLTTHTQPAFDQLKSLFGDKVWDHMGEKLCQYAEHLRQCKKLLRREQDGVYDLNNVSYIPEDNTIVIKSDFRDFLLIMKHPDDANNILSGLRMLYSTYAPWEKLKEENQILFCEIPEFARRWIRIRYHVAPDIANACTLFKEAKISEELQESIFIHFSDVALKIAELSTTIYFLLKDFPRSPLPETSLDEQVTLVFHTPKSPKLISLIQPFLHSLVESSLKGQAIVNVLVGMKHIMETYRNFNSGFDHNMDGYLTIYKHFKELIQFLFELVSKNLNVECAGSIMNTAIKGWKLHHCHLSTEENIKLQTNFFELIKKNPRVTSFKTFLEDKTKEGTEDCRLYSLYVSTETKDNRERAFFREYLAFLEKELNSQYRNI